MGRSHDSSFVRGKLTRITSEGTEVLEFVTSGDYDVFYQPTDGDTRGESERSHSSRSSYTQRMDCADTHDTLTICSDHPLPDCLLLPDGLYRRADTCSRGSRATASRTASQRSNSNISGSRSTRYRDTASQVSSASRSSFTSERSSGSRYSHVSRPSSVTNGHEHKCKCAECKYRRKWLKTHDISRHVPPWSGSHSMASIPEDSCPTEYRVVDYPRGSRRGRSWKDLFYRSKGCTTTIISSRRS